MSLLKTVEEQTVFNFTGKVNLLVKKNGQFIGSIFLKDGRISNSFFGKYEGIEALLSLMLYDRTQKSDCRYVVEPEVIDSFDCAFHLSINELKMRSAKFYERFERAKSLAPPSHLRVRVTPAFLEKETKLSRFEYSILQSICDLSKVEEIYKQLDLPDYLITIGLVSLREKGALKVCKSK